MCELFLRLRFIKLQQYNFSLREIFQRVVIIKEGEKYIYIFEIDYHYKSHSKIISESIYTKKPLKIGAVL